MTTMTKPDFVFVTNARPTEREDESKHSRVLHGWPQLPPNLESFLERR